MRNRMLRTASVLTLAMGVALSMAVLVAQTTDVDTANPAVSLGINCGIGRQMHGGFPDSAMNADVVGVAGLAAQVHIELSDAHFDFDSTEQQAA